MSTGSTSLVEDSSSHQEVAVSFLKRPRSGKETNSEENQELPVQDLTRQVDPSRPRSPTPRRQIDPPRPRSPTTPRQIDPPRPRAPTLPRQVDPPRPRAPTLPRQGAPPRPRAPTPPSLPSLDMEFELMDESDCPSIAKKAKESQRYVTDEDFERLRAEFGKLKKKIEKIQKTQEQSFNTPQKTQTETPTALSARAQSPLPSATTPVPPTPSSPPLSPINELYNGHTLSELHDKVCHKDDLYSSVHTLLLALFPVPYITSHSISGQRANSKCDAKPKFDGRLYNIFVQIIEKKFPGVMKTAISAKVQSVQKKYAKKASKN